VSAAAAEGTIDCTKRIPRIKVMTRIPERTVFVIGV